MVGSKVQLMASLYYIGLYSNRIKTSDNIIPAIRAELSGKKT
jgi:hypothetical protein